MKCEGMRRTGGAFTLGPVEWKQCESEAILKVKCKQDKEVAEFPACLECYTESHNAGIVVSVSPILGDEFVDKTGRIQEPT